MKKIERLLPAFLIPFVLAFLLLYCEKYFFVLDVPDNEKYISVPHKSAVSFGLYDDFSPDLKKLIYYGLIFGLFALSLLLPAFVALRSESIKRIEIKLKDI